MSISTYGVHPIYCGAYGCNVCIDKRLETSNIVTRNVERFIVIIYFLSGWHYHGEDSI